MQCVLCGCVQIQRYGCEIRRATEVFSNLLSFKAYMMKCWHLFNTGGNEPSISPSKKKNLCQTQIMKIFSCFILEVLSLNESHSVLWSLFSQGDGRNMWQPASCHGVSVPRSPADKGRWPVLLWSYPPPVLGALAVVTDTGPRSALSPPYLVQAEFANLTDQPVQC